MYGLILMLMLFQAAVAPAPMTAVEREMAMKQANFDIKMTQGSISKMAMEEKNAHDSGIRLQTQKAALIAQWKKKLALDSTWTWDDTKGWVQAK